jgi:ribosomal protein S18 acetylase RimI-like enzyme
MATLVASWEEYARGVDGASVLRLPGATAAVFAREPERSVYNNALLERAEAVAAMEAAYAEAGVERFAAWVHEGDSVLRAAIERRGYTVVEATLAMGTALDTALEATRAMATELAGVAPPRAEIEVTRAGWSEYLRVADLPAGLVAGVDPDAFRVVVGRLDGDVVAAGISYDHAGDCGIYNVVTREHARRRGIGTAITAALLHDARERGCQTASLQSTPVAERVYAAVGFRDLGRILEYAPRVSRPEAAGRS